MMTTCRDHSDDKVGITTIFDFGYYSWSGEHQDYHCSVLSPTTISWKWISFILPCFKYASSGDSAQHTASHFEEWINFLWQMSHKGVNCVTACLEINDTALSRSIETSHIVPQSNRNQTNDASWLRPHSGTLWHICEYVIFGIFWEIKHLNLNLIFSSITYKKCFSYKTKLIFSRV